MSGSRHDSTTDSVLHTEDVELLERRQEERMAIPRKFKRKLLPELPARLKLHPSDLMFRTYKCLKRAGFIDHPERLSQCTIDELLELPNFGTRSLLDLLRALRPWLPSGQTLERRNVKRNPKIEAELLREAKHLSGLAQSDQVRSDDPRMGHLIRRLDAEAVTASDIPDRFLSGALAPVNPALFAKELRELREAIENLLKLPLEDELIGFTRGIKSERNRTIIVRRFALDGQEPATLEEIGQSLGLERERIRQICKQFPERFKESYPVFAPALSRALEFVAAQLPEKADTIEERLMAEGISRTRFRLRALERVAELLGQEVPFTLRRAGSERVAVHAGAKFNAHRVYSVARSIIELYGMANIDDTAAIAAKHISLPVELVTELLSRRPEFHWLDKENGWFWLHSVKRNRVLLQVEKIMAVAERIDVGELRAGVSRPHRMKGFAPPTRVLLELCRQLSWCRVDGHTISTSSRLAPEGVLTEVELTLFRILRENSNVLPRARFEELCLEAGINQKTFEAYIKYSPIIERYAPSIYGLRGARVDARTLDLLARGVPKRSQVRKDFGRTPMGRIWINYELSQSAIKHGDYSVPSALRSHLAGEYELLSEDGSTLGQITVGKSNLYGLRRLCRRRGAEPGDFLTLLFDPQRREVTFLFSSEGAMTEEDIDEIEESLPNKEKATPDVTTSHATTL